MTKIVMMKGLPGSGKSTKAAEYVAKGYMRCNRDDFVKMIAGGKWSKRVNSLYLDWRDGMVHTAIEDGFNLVVDDTNFESKHEQRIRQIAKLLPERSVEILVDFIDTPYKECVKRDLKRPNSVGSQVIRRMYNKYLAKQEEKPERIQGLPTCIVVDVDGTVADMTGVRGPFEWDKVGLDKPKDDVIEVIIRCVDGAYGQNLVFMSARDGVCYEQTQQWLSTHFGTGTFSLYMRAAGDQREDSIVKKELYEEHIKGKYNVAAVFDDRDRVVDLWRSLGLTTFQVDEGDF